NDNQHDKPESRRHPAVADVVELLIHDHRASAENQQKGGAEDFGQQALAEVVEAAVPAHRNGVAAHHAGRRRGVEGSYQLFHVARVVARLHQVVQEAAHRQVGDGKQAVEDDAVVLEQCLLELPL
nr:hypothetical protein [Tanacetum cinerariifolium]